MKIDRISTQVKFLLGLISASTVSLPIAASATLLYVGGIKYIGDLTPTGYTGIISEVSFNSNSYGSPGVFVNNLSNAAIPSPSSLATDLNSNLYVSGSVNSNGDSEVREFNSNGALVKILRNSTNTSGALATDSNGNIFYAADRNTVRERDSSGNLVKTITVGSNNTVIDAIAVDLTGNLYVRDFGSDTVRELNPSGTLVKTINIPGVVSSGGLAVDPTGNVYVQSLSGLQKYNSSGILTQVLAPPARIPGSFFTPGPIAVDSTGYVYAASSTETYESAFGMNTLPDFGVIIQQFNSSGNLINEALAHNVYPISLAIAPSLINSITTGSEPLIITDTPIVAPPVPTIGLTSILQDSVTPVSATAYKYNYTIGGEIRDNFGLSGTITKFAVPYFADAGITSILSPTGWTATINDADTFGLGFGAKTLQWSTDTAGIVGVYTPSYTDAPGSFTYASLSGFGYTANYGAVKGPFSLSDGTSSVYGDPALPGSPNAIAAGLQPLSSTSVPEPFTVIGTLIGGTAVIRIRRKLKAIAD